MAKELEGKVFLVTGATEGIGKAASLEFAKRGATLVLVGRNKAKSEQVLAELKKNSGNDHIELLLGDLSKMADIRAVTAAFKRKYDRLDVLANNAGAAFNTLQHSEDGLEMTFALNHIGYFLFTYELMELIKKTPGARVVSTSSGAHQAGRISEDQFETIARRTDGKTAFRPYGDSKLANVLMTRELARRLKGSTATANCFHPGFVQTGFGMNTSGMLKMLIKFTASIFARTPEKGAETLIWLATSPEAANHTGQYFFDKKVARITANAQDDGLATKFWEYSAKLCGVA